VETEQGHSGLDSSSLESSQQLRGCDSCAGAQQPCMTSGRMRHAHSGIDTPEGNSHPSSIQSSSA